MAAHHEETEERALWAGIVALEEGASLTRRLASLDSMQRERLENEAALKEQLAAQVKNSLAKLQRVEIA